MILVRKANDRGLTQTEWLESYHSFSFGEYYDPKHMGFGPMRVLNEDRVQPGKGFGTHGHQEMEIISYVIEGALAHKDSMGTGSIIKPGEIQRMSAGTGVMHSEFNHSQQGQVHFLQIWILPKQKGIMPSYEQKKLPQSKNKLLLIGSPKGGENSIIIHQDVSLYAAFLDPKIQLKYDFEGTKGWLQMVKGEIEINGHTLRDGDGVALENEKQIHINCLEKAEFLLFDFQ